MKKKILLSVITFVLLISVCACGDNGATSTTASSREVTSIRYKEPAQVVDPNKVYYAVIRTSIGDMTVYLFDDYAPIAVNSFVFLAEKDFYDNMIFFRNIDGFMVQTGDPNNIGNGNPGYLFESELPPNYYYEPGIVALANAGAGTVSNGSQFFICTGENSYTLNYNPIYVQIGYVTEGLEIAQAIAAREVKENPITGEESYPVDPVYINSIEIFVMNSDQLN